jgi:FG-GAP repeat protein
MRLGIPIVVAAALALPSAVQASTIDLASAPGTIRVDGASRDDQLGEAVANAGDVNGDGIPDTIVGVRNADPAGRTDAGSADVLYGGQSLIGVDLRHLGSAGFRIDGAATQDHAGTSVARAGDVNGDGIGDVIVGAPGANSVAGSAYVIYGRGTADPGNVDLAEITTTQSARGMRIDGAVANDDAGAAVAGGQDLNGDGQSDIIVGAPLAANNGRFHSGSAYVVYGEQTADPADLNLADIATAAAARGMRIDGAVAGDGAGLELTAVRDLNDDGIPDAVISAPFASNNTRQESGSVYVVYGEKGDDPTDIDLAQITTVQAARGMRIDGPSFLAGEQGLAVAGGRDLNGDGINDLLIGSPVASIGHRFGGIAYVVYGQPADGPDLDLGEIGTSAAERGFSIRGAEGGDEAGFAVAVGSDVNGDGRPDAIVGADDASNNHRLLSGSAYVIFGQRSADPSNIDLARLETTQATRGLRIDGAARGEHAGSAVAASAGDLDGDDRPDVIVGAPVAHNGRQDSGSVYLVGLGPVPPPPG